MDFSGIVTNSSQVLNYKYEGRSKELTITFVKGAVYVYIDVPLGTALAFRKSESKGAFIHTPAFKKYRYERKN